MYIIKNYKSILAHLEQINEYVNLAVKIHKIRQTQQSSQDLDYILCEAKKMISHLIEQMHKGISSEEQLHNIEILSSHIPENALYVSPLLCCLDIPQKPKTP